MFGSEQEWAFDPADLPALEEVSESYVEARDRLRELRKEKSKLAGQVASLESELEKVRSGDFDAEAAADAILQGEEPGDDDFPDAAELDSELTRNRRRLEALEAAISKMDLQVAELVEGDAKLDLADALQSKVGPLGQAAADAAAELYRMLRLQYDVMRHCRSETRRRHPKHGPQRGYNLSGPLPYVMPRDNGNIGHFRLDHVLNAAREAAEAGKVEFDDPREED